MALHRAFSSFKLMRGCKGMRRRQAAVRQYSRPARRVTADVYSKEIGDFCQETCEMPFTSWKYSHELEAREGGVQRHVQAAGRREPMESSGKKSDCRTCAARKKATFARKLMKCPLFPGNIRMRLEAREGGVEGMCRRQAAVSQCSGPAGRVTADVCSKKKTTFAKKLMKCRLFPGNIRLSLKDEKAGCRAMCRRQAADSQCNRPAGRVTADVCSMEKVDFCQETCEMPIVSWKYSHELEGGEGGVQRHVQAAGRREAIQSPGKKSDCPRVQQ